MPDLTKSQRQGEKRLREEAESRNQELSGEDRDRNLKWIVVGSRGEKRIIKGTEREDFRGHGGGRGRGGPAGGRGGGNNGPTGDRTVEDREGGIGNGSRAVGCEESGAETRQPNTGNNQPGPNSNSYYRNNSTAPTYSRNGNYNGNGGNNTNGYSDNGSNGNNGRGYGNNYSNGGYGYRNNDNGYFRGGRGRPSISYSERGRDNYTSYRPAPTNGNGNGYRSRPWQETGARRKEGPTYVENYQEREQLTGPGRTGEDDIVWGAGNLPDPIGNKPRERLNSKRTRDWEEEDDRDSRRMRS